MNSRTFESNWKGTHLAFPFFLILSVVLCQNQVSRIFLSRSDLCSTIGGLPSLKNSPYRRSDCCFFEPVSVPEPAGKQVHRLTSQPVDCGFSLNCWTNAINLAVIKWCQPLILLFLAIPLRWMRGGMRSDPCSDWIATKAASDKTHAELWRCDSHTSQHHSRSRMMTLVPR